MKAKDKVGKRCRVTLPFILANGSQYPAGSIMEVTGANSQGKLRGMLVGAQRVPVTGVPHRLVVPCDG